MIKLMRFGLPNRIVVVEPKLDFKFDWWFRSNLDLNEDFESTIVILIKRPSKCKLFNWKWSILSKLVNFIKTGQFYRKWLNLMVNVKFYQKSSRFRPFLIKFDIFLIKFKIEFWVQIRIVMTSKSESSKQIE